MKADNAMDMLDFLTVAVRTLRSLTQPYAALHSLLGLHPFVRRLQSHVPRLQPYAS